MDLSLSPAEREFRDAVRGWIEANHPGREPDSDPELFEFRKAWQRALNDRGWAGLNWPTEYGGAGATQVEQAIFFEEVARAGAPSMANVLGLAMGGPTVIAHGTDEQKQRYLPPILSADEIWCQGFSEPESGSDLASLKTRAVRRRRRVGRDRPEGVDHLRARGQVVHAASPAPTRRRPKHRGLTYFLLDMEQDGVEVRPLVQITGESEFNELFLEEARVPHENIVGGEGNGWPVAITTLMHERAGLAFALQVRVQVALRELRDLIREAGLDGDPVIRQRYGQLVAEAQVLRLTAYRGLTRDAPGPEGSLGKWHWAEVNQSLTELAMDVAGSPVSDGPWQYRFLRARGELDRGRHHRDPQEHRRRARAGSAASMNFDLSEDQRTIKSTAREFLAARYPLGRGAAAGAGGWARLHRPPVGRDGRLGWPEIAELGTVELSCWPRSWATRWRRRRCRRRGRRACSARRSTGGGAGRRRPGRRRRVRRRAGRLGRRAGDRRRVEPGRVARPRRGGCSRVGGGSGASRSAATSTARASRAKRS